MKQSMPGGPRTQPTSLNVVAKLLPTPTANQYEQDNDVLLARREREAAKGRNGNGFGLTTANALALLPTPTGDDANNVTRASGEYRSLAREANRLLPTPAATDAKGGRSSDGHSPPLPITARLLPTPQAADGSGGRQEKGAMANHGRRPSGQKATLPLPTAVSMRGELTATPFAAGSDSSGPLPGQLTIEDA